MTGTGIPRPLHRVLDWLGDVGSRWGLPVEACRVHGYLYLLAKPVGEAELRDRLELGAKAVAEALAWLSEYRLIEPAGPDSWRTHADPWELMMRVLDERQRRELGPALKILRDARRAVLTSRECSRGVGIQIGKLVDKRAISSKAYVARRHLAMPASTGYWINAAVARAIEGHCGTVMGRPIIVRANFFAGIGFANRKPWTKSKPISRTARKSARVSTPSATQRAPWPIRSLPTVGVTWPTISNGLLATAKARPRRLRNLDPTRRHLATWCKFRYSPWTGIV